MSHIIVGTYYHCYGCHEEVKELDRCGECDRLLCVDCISEYGCVKCEGDDGADFHWEEDRYGDD